MLSQKEFVNLTNYFYHINYDIICMSGIKKTKLLQSDVATRFTMM